MTYKDDLKDVNKKVITEAKAEVVPEIVPEVMLVPKGIGLNKEKPFNCKIGGKPDWIQDNKIPRCKKCKNDMSFVGQLASIGCKGNVKDNIDKLIFGDCGCFYVFSCFDCGNKTQVIFQNF